uniref:Uncharacterized protein n=1 Tax=Arundo donax TaxID=35708 RepID=A0A0A9EAQ8_ARUDO
MPSTHYKVTAYYLASWPDIVIVLLENEIWSHYQFKSLTLQSIQVMICSHLDRTEACYGGHLVSFSILAHNNAQLRIVGTSKKEL